MSFTASLLSLSSSIPIRLRWIAAVAARPQSFREDGDVISAGLIVVGGEQAADDRDDAEHRKRAGGDPQRRNVLGLPVARQCRNRAGYRCDLAETSGLAPEFGIIRGRGRNAVQRVASRVSCTMTSRSGSG